MKKDWCDVLKIGSSITRPIGMFCVGDQARGLALSRDPYQLGHAAPDRELVSAAAVLAKGLVSVIDGGGLRPQRA
jgi:hypothetical protein